MDRTHRRILAVLAIATASTLAAACAPQEYHRQTPAVYLSPAGCVQVNQDYLYTTGGYALRYLTVGTGDPAVAPWWEGGTTDEHPDWSPNDPYLGRGFEGAVAFEMAERLGFSDDDVRFVPVDFQESFAPGDKDFDFALQQISSLPERADGVDFSVGYHDVSQALVSVRGSPIAHATSLGELEDAHLGAATGTTSLMYIQDTIRPRAEATAYDDLGAAVRGLRDGAVEGVVADLPTASRIAEEQVRGGVLVGRLPTAGTPEHLAMAFEEGSPIVDCVDLALQEMKEDGTLDAISRRWLAGDADAPMIEG